MKATKDELILTKYQVLQVVYKVLLNEIHDELFVKILQKFQTDNLMWYTDKFYVNPNQHADFIDFLRQIFKYTKNKGSRLTEEQVRVCCDNFIDNKFKNDVDTQDKKVKIKQSIVKDLEDLLAIDIEVYDMATCIIPSLTLQIEWNFINKAMLAVACSDDSIDKFEQILKYFTDGTYSNLDFSKRIENKSVDLVDVMDDIFNNNQQLIQTISTGYTRLDQYLMNGGIPINDGYLFLIMAPTGVGKSMFMANMITKMALAGKKVGIFTLQMSQKIYVSRLVNIFLDCSTEELKNPKIKQIKAKQYAQLKNSISNTVLIKSFPASTCTAANIKNQLYKWQIEKDFVPDVIFVDYLTIMRSVNSKLAPKGYQSGAAIAEQVRSLSQQFKIPIISAVQTNRSQNFNSADVGLENVSESYGISSTCDFLASLWQMNDDKSQGILRLKIIKNRNGSTDKIIPFQVDYNKQKIQEF